MLRLLRYLRADRPLLVLTIVIAIGACAPLFFTPILPFVDTPTNVGAASLLWDAFAGHMPVAHYYRVHWSPIPYWTPYLFIAVANAIGGGLFASKALMAFVTILLPLGAMRLLLALRRDPRVGLWAFLLAWDHNAYWGWQAHALGMAVALFVIAALLECESLRDALFIAPWTAFVALTHPLALGFLLAAGAAVSISIRAPLRRLGYFAIASLGVVPTFVPWLQHLFERPPGAPDPELAYQFHTLAQKASNIFHYTLDVVPGRLGSFAGTFAFLTLLVGPLFLATTKARAREGRGARRLFFVAIALYLTLPMAIEGATVSHWYTYPRFASLALLLMLMIPRPDLRGSRLVLLAPGIAAALVLDVAVSFQLAAFSRNVTPFVDVMNKVDMGAPVYAIPSFEGDPSVPGELQVFKMLPCYIAGERKGYSPLLFDHPNNPLAFIPGRRLAVPRRGAPFHAAEHRGFRYVLVTGLEKDPFRPEGPQAGEHVRLVTESGRFRLYENLEYSQNDNENPR